MEVDAKPVSVRTLTGVGVQRCLPELVDLLREVVDGGHPMGFLAPLSAADATDYWLSLAADLDKGSRVLLVASIEDRLVGSGQLFLARAPNGRHRAELQKLFVARDLRGRGVGRLIMAALHDEARERGRSLLTLYTRVGGGALEFYKELGYREVGVIPGYTVGGGGERYDTMMLYRELPVER